MSFHITFLGEPPPSDSRLIAGALRQLSGDNDIGMDVYPNGTETKDTRTHAYISYIPCKPGALRDIFGRLPLGAGGHVPFFQMVNGDAIPPECMELPVYNIFQSPLSAASAFMLASAIVQHEKVMEQNRTLMSEVAKYRKQKHQLVKIGTALSVQNDLLKLLDMILAECRDLVGADAGSIYIRKRIGPGKPFTNQLQFMISQNDSVDVAAKSRTFTVEIDTNTIAGYVAHTGETLNIDDVDELDAAVTYKFGRNFEREFGYRVKSMLTVPLKNLAGQVVGVVQLMNKKKAPDMRLAEPDSVAENVMAFTHSDEDFVHTIASLAAVSIERVQLYEDIQQLFEGFLDSAIAAVDERDRVTSGHSRRVMGYALAFVDAVNAAAEGPYAAVQFSEARKRQFKFAALLHDIGKIGVPEQLLTKETRLPMGALDALLARFEIVRAQLCGHLNSPPAWESVEQLDADREFIEAVNTSGFLSDKDYGRLCAIRAKKYTDSSGRTRAIIEDSEWEALSLRKGNLTDAERNLINFHAVSTRRILSKIPWTHELENIPDIAAHHHEKIDGSGYPDGLTGKEMSLECKILAVVDIYEALVAQDRPYKRAMPPEKALEILRSEAKSGRLDADVVDFFIEKQIYRIFLGNAAVPRPQTLPRGGAPYVSRHALPPSREAARGDFHQSTDA